MKRVALLILIFGIPSVAAGEVSTRVCLADGNTPFPPIDPNFPHVYPDIMVGTKLTIIVSSDTAEYFWGSLIIEGTNLNYGALSARDYNESTSDWEGSRFEAAGTGARVYTLEESGKYGFQLCGHSSAVAGDWFIIDYNSINLGDCNVSYYNYNIKLYDPIYYLEFSHVPTRDFNKDNKVDFADFAVLASYWQVMNCQDWDLCEGADLDTDGDVDRNDLRLFVKYWLDLADYWLQKTE